jgi:hypothetical protein
VSDNFGVKNYSCAKSGSKGHRNEQNTFNRTKQVGGIFLWKGEN